VSQGAIIDGEFIVNGGYNAERYPRLPTATAETYVLNVTDPDAAWIRMDDIPIPEGVTHTATAQVGTKWYLCGGSLGGNPGPDTAECYVYDQEEEPGSGKQWSRLPDLPEKRSAAGMVYDSTRNALFFAGGAIRPIQNILGIIYSIDKRDHWMLDLNNTEAGWVEQPQILCKGNHLSSITGLDTSGRERHLFAGGQIGENRWFGQRDGLYEWDSIENVWTEHASIPFARSHAQASTIALGCGFIMTGGIERLNTALDDIHYYDIPTDTWTKVGTIPFRLNVPVCSVFDDYLYCTTGGLSHRRQFVIDNFFSN